MPETVDKRPPLVPLHAEWSDQIWIRPEHTTHILQGTAEATLLDVELEVQPREETGPLLLQVIGAAESTFAIDFGPDGASYRHVDGPTVSIRRGPRWVPIDEWFLQEPPIIRFHTGAFLAGDQLFTPASPSAGYDPDKIQAWDWTPTNIRRESQGVERDASTIQHRVLQQLDRDPMWDVIVDDDGTGEAADIVAIAADLEAERLRIHLYHCKYSAGPGPGARVEDLYEVCGQAQKSVHWKQDRHHLIEHLKRRDASRSARHNVSRFERGSQEVLNRVAHQLPYLVPEFEVFIVQPGLSKSSVSQAQLDLLATTELYLSETYAVPLTVIGSE